jgi:alpha-glucosidase
VRWSESHELVSPARVTSVTVGLVEGVPFYAVRRFGRDVIRPSRLGFELRHLPALSGDFEIASVERTARDTTWETVWGEFRWIRDHHNELRVNLVERTGARRRLTLVFRAFDEGVGFRYEIPAQPGLGAFEIMNELTEFALNGDHRTWSIGAYQWNRFEYLPEETALSAIKVAHTPLTMRTADGLHLAIHEAALVDYSTMTLARVAGNTLKADIMPWGDSVLVRAAAPMKTPWRTIYIADRAGDLVTNTMMLNLNEPNRIEDTSWIRPGKYVGIWWGMHIDKYTWAPGPKLGATTATAKAYIDFAAANGFDHVLVEGWNKGWDGEWWKNGEVFDFLKPNPEFDLEEIARYARSKGVRLMGHHETSAGIEHYEKQMAEAFALYERLGVSAVKTGYVGHGTEIRRTGPDGRIWQEWHHGQYMVDHHQRVVELAARHRIMLNVHEGLKGTGTWRTWPNMMTREVARGQEYNAWGEKGGNPPDYLLKTLFTRMLAGPFDYTPGIVDLHFDRYRAANRVNHTLAKELALYVVIYSPLQMAADLPEHYEADPAPFRFIKAVPTDWERTIVLDAEIGQFATIARKDRGSEAWYLGSITNEEGRLLRVPLHFLDEGKRYIAEIYRDGENADWRTNAQDIVVEERTVDRSTVLTLRLAAGGGQAIRFRPAAP